MRAELSPSVALDPVIFCTRHPRRSPYLPVRRVSCPGRCGGRANTAWSISSTARAPAWPRQSTSWQACVFRFAARFAATRRAVAQSLCVAAGVPKGDSLFHRATTLPSSPFRAIGIGCIQHLVRIAWEDTKGSPFASLWSKNRKLPRGSTERAVGPGKLRSELSERSSLMPTIHVTDDDDVIVLDW